MKTPSRLSLAMLLLAALACGGSLETAGPAAQSPRPTTPPAPSQEAAPSDPLLAGMAAQPLEFSRHARCRMQCRHVATAEIESALRTGTIDPSRTRTDGRCDSHAVHSTGSEGERLRVVFAACETETLVVTVIDLDTDWPCDCD